MRAKIPVLAGRRPRSNVCSLIAVVSQKDFVCLSIITVIAPLAPFAPILFEK